MKEEWNLSDKIEEYLEPQDEDGNLKTYANRIHMQDVKEFIVRLKRKFLKLSQRTKGGLDEFFDEINELAGEKLK